MSDTSGARLELRGIRKAFGATKALVDLSLEVRPGEVHTILGENGSGKSTLVKILSGVHRADEGSFLIDGQAASPRSPRAARASGVATVFQEVLTIPGRTVLDNVWLGADGILKRTSSAAARRARASEVLQELLGRSQDLDTPAGALPLSDRQAVCIARALVLNPRILVLDESTAALDVATRDRLFQTVRRLTSSGVSVVFISHRMDEITAISDRVTVVRSGITVAANVLGDEITPQRLIALMTGSQSTSRRPHEIARGDVVLSVDQFRVRPDAAPIDFQLRRGEIVGLGGLEGQGQDAFLKALAGLVSGTGSIRRIEGSTSREVTGRSVAACRIAYLPRERRSESLFAEMSIRENFAMPTLPTDTLRGFVMPRRSSRRLGQFRDRLGIRYRHDSDPISSLSGGNQQKVVIARWLASAPEVVLLNDPTRGVDQVTKHELYALLENLCSEGLSVVMLSSEMDELIDLMDRVLIFRDFEVFAELPREALTRDALAAAYFGHEVEVAQ